MSRGLLSALDLIFSMIEHVSGIPNLLSATAGPRIVTVDDLRSVTAGANARFFFEITFADMETRHSLFHNTWLPSINQAASGGRVITPSDINSPGRLNGTFRSLEREARKTFFAMNQLIAVYRSNHSHLLTDELTRGLYALFNGYALLFHMHAAYAELRRIQIGASRLEDPSLLPETLLALEYVSACEASTEWLQMTTRQKRVELVSQVTPGGGYPLVKRYWYYHDRYESRPQITPANLDLMPPPPPPARSLNYRHRPTVVNLRAQRVVNVNARTQEVILTPYQNVRQRVGRLATMLGRRRDLQVSRLRAARVQRLAFLELEESTDDEAETTVVELGEDSENVAGVLDQGPELGGVEKDVELYGYNSWAGGHGHCPVDAEEYLALAERLLDQADLWEVEEKYDGHDIEPLTEEPSSGEEVQS